MNEAERTALESLLSQHLLHISDNLVGDIVAWADKRAEGCAEKLAYVEKMGLRLGYLKTSDQEKPRIAHYWEEGCDQDRVFKEWSASIGHEYELARLQAKLDKAILCLRLEQTWRERANDDADETSDDIRIKANHLRAEILSEPQVETNQDEVIAALEKKVKDLEWFQQCNLKDEANMLATINLYRQQLTLVEGVCYRLHALTRRSEAEAARYAFVNDELSKVRSYLTPPP